MASEGEDVGGIGLQGGGLFSIERSLCFIFYLVFMSLIEVNLDCLKTPPCKKLSRFLKDDRGEKCDVCMASLGFGKTLLEHYREQHVLQQG